MNKKQIMVLALMATASASTLTSCHQDAPELNYNHTVNITVNNDFTALVEAINKGNISVTDAIKKMVEAIDRQRSSTC